MSESFGLLVTALTLGMPCANGNPRLGKAGGKRVTEVAEMRVSWVFITIALYLLEYCTPSSSYTGRRRGVKVSCDSSLQGVEARVH